MYSYNIIITKYGNLLYTVLNITRKGIIDITISIILIIKNLSIGN